MPKNVLICFCYLVVLIHDIVYFLWVKVSIHLSLKNSGSLHEKLHLSTCILRLIWRNLLKIVFMFDMCNNIRAVSLSLLSDKKQMYIANKQKADTGKIQNNFNFNFNIIITFIVRRSVLEIERNLFASSF